MRASFLGILASALISCLGSASAATSGGTLSVGATVIGTCNFSAAPMMLSPYVPGIGVQSGSTRLNVACSTGAPFNVIVDGRVTRPDPGQSLASNYTLRYAGTRADAITVSIEY